MKSKKKNIYSLWKRDAVCITWHFKAGLWQLVLITPLSCTLTFRRGNGTLGYKFRNWCGKQHWSEKVKCPLQLFSSFLFVIFENIVLFSLHNIQGLFCSFSQTLSAFIRFPWLTHHHFKIWIFKLKRFQFIFASSFSFFFLFHTSNGTQRWTG